MVYNPGITLSVKGITPTKPVPGKQRLLMRKLKSILLVDDDEVACFLHKLLIRDMEITEHIETALNGQQALTLLNERACSNSSDKPYPELIFLDVNMPMVDGFEFLQRFEAAQPSTASPIIVMLSSSQDARDLERAKLYRILTFLNKPLTEEKVRRVLEEIT